MSNVKRIYLIGYVHAHGGGRFFNHRETDDAPTMEQIESMEEKLRLEHGKTCAITAVSQLGNSEKSE